MRYRLKTSWVIVAAMLGSLVGVISGNLPLGIFIFGLALAPSIVAVYIPYAKDNPRHLWFKQKLYGWGWTPVTWQGWLVTLAYIGLMILFASTIDDASPAREVALMFILPAILLTVAFIRIALKRGERPRWRWGREKKDRR